MELVSKPSHLTWNLESGDNLNTTQTLEYTKDKYNVKIRKWKGLSQGPTNNLHRPKDEMKKMWKDWRG
jgi:hypothetical protein